MRRHPSACWLAAAVGITAVLAGCGTGANVSPTSQVSSDAPPVTESSTTSTTAATATSDSSTTTSASTSPTSTVTVPAPQVVPVPPPTVQDAPDAPVGGWHFEGRQYVIETIALNTGRCPMLDQHVQGQLTETNGAVWGFSAQVCAVIDARNVWSGGGTVRFTSPSRGSLRGTYFNLAQLPTDGVPYVIRIRSGTGEFAGAHGRCVLEESIRKLSLLVQEKSGEFVCDVAR